MAEIIAQGGWGAVLAGDCLEAIESGQIGELSAGAIDHVMTDPPYEKAMHDNSGQGENIPKRMRNRLEFESIDAIRPVITPHLVDLSCGWLMAFCTAEGVAAWRDAIEAAGGRYKRAMPWVKTDAAPQMNGQGPAHCLEMIVLAWCARGHSSWNGGGRAGEFRGSKNLNRTRLPSHRPHKTEKPVWLMSELVMLFTQPGDLVFDPFGGIGTTGVAAARNGRRIILIEKDAEYAAAAAARISDAAAQPDMFIKPKAKQESLF